MPAIQLSFNENAPTNNVNFCKPGAYTTTWIVYLQKIFHDEPETRFLMNFVRAKTISGPKNPIMAASGQSPETHIFFTGSHGLITVIYRWIAGFWKPGFYSKFENAGLVWGKYGISTGKGWGPHFLTMPGGW
jgi:hypothetical protein